MENHFEEYLSTGQVSREIGIPVGTLRYWRHIGEGPSSFILGRRRVAYKRSSLTAWLADQESASTRGGVA